MEPAKSDGPATSTESSHEPESPETAPVRIPPRRQSSVRFANETNTISQSPMSRGWRNVSHDEVTPIRSAEGRNYNTRNSEDDNEDGHRDQDQDGATPAKPSGSSARATTRQEDTDDRPPWYKRVAEKYGSVSLENKGSVARDHLALERTFLAWLRTSLAFASIGIAVTQLFRLNTTIASRSQQYSAAVPFSPYLGQSLPIELLPYLQQVAASAASTIPTLGPTLFDQLLMLPPPGGLTPNIPAQPVHAKAFNEHAAAKLRHAGKPLGATFLGISIIILFIGFHRYFEAQYWIIRGKFPASRGSIFIVGFIAGALIIASLIVVLVVAPTSFQTKR